MKLVLRLSLIAALHLAGTVSASIVKPNAGVIHLLSPHHHGVNSEDNGLEIEIIPTNGPWTHGTLGLSLPSGVGPWTHCESDDPSIYLCAQWGDFAQVLLKYGKDPNRCTRVEWTSTHAREIEDCYDLDSSVSWYGGGEMWNQRWPINQRTIRENPYINLDEFTSVVEKYWLLSSGASLVIDPDTPLHFSLNTTHPDRICFKAQDGGVFTSRKPLKMNYEWCTGSDVKDVHLFAINTFFDKPTGIPDEEMLVRPLWSTWAQFTPMSTSQLFWTTPEELLAKDLETPVISKSMTDGKDEHEGYCVDSSFHKYNCPLFDEGFQKGYFVKTPKGKTGITSWWQGEYSGLIDVTNPEAAKWWTDRLRKLQAETGVDSFKFDAGETDYLPSSPVFSGDDTRWPLIYPKTYVETCATFGGLIETRTANLNQKQPIFVRMLDKSSGWDYHNGLKSMIPSLLFFSIVGYPFVLPDMIGGNAYEGRPDKELYVRWMQANIFMPAVQFSIPPWTIDDETVKICLNVLEHREKYREEILAAARQATVDGSPMNRPLWWEAPTDPETFTIDDEYMLGDTILVAPIVEEGAVSRDIYLPPGTWTSGLNSSEVYTGPQWLRSYPAPLDVVPFFIKSA